MEIEDTLLMDELPINIVDQLKEFQ